MSRFVAVEFGKDEKGDFDNRPLGRNGEFLFGDQVREPDIANFTTYDAALVAAENAPRRPNSKVSVIGRVS